MPDPTPTTRQRGQLTTQGRAVARFNALKHGIHSARVLITDGPYPESERELKRLAAQFHAEFAPSGIAEELLVERLLVLYWRLRRIIVAESNLVAHRLQHTLRVEAQNAALSATLRGQSPEVAAADPTICAQVERATIAAQLLRPDDIDRLTTYETTLEKAFHRTLRELLDLQRRRQRPTTPTDPPATTPARTQIAIRIDRLELHPQTTPATPIENPENEIAPLDHKHPVPISNLTTSPPIHPSQKPTQIVAKHPHHSTKHRTTH